jgi:hypothetical protein
VRGLHIRFHHQPPRRAQDPPSGASFAARVWALVEALIRKRRKPKNCHQALETGPGADDSHDESKAKPASNSVAGWTDGWVCGAEEDRWRRARRA